jgi:hypothetical protein
MATQAGWRVHLGLGIALSLALHGLGLGTLSFVLPRVRVRPGIPDTVELAVVQEPARPAPPTAAAPPDNAALPAAPPTAATPGDLTRKPTTPARPRVSPPRTPAAPPATPATARVTSAHPQADPRSDGSALERVLRQIAATTTLTQDERRKAMLVVLRTWENPGGTQDAQQLIDALLANLRAAKLEPATETVGE